MMSRLKARLSFANVVSLLAVFVALGGSAYAAGVLPVNSVGTPQLKTGSVTSGKVKDGTLKAADFARNALKAGPQGSIGPAGPLGPVGVVDVSQFSTKAASDARYLRGGLVTVVASLGFPNVGGNLADERATCPSGFQAISGGLDSSSRQDVFFSGSEPIVEGQDITALSDGLHGGATAWRVFGNNVGAAGGTTFAVVVVCAPVA